MSIFLSLLSLFWMSLAYAQPTPVPVTNLEEGVRQALRDVPQYRFLHEEGRRMGVSVYLFGGTASTLAHHIRFQILDSSKKPLAFQNIYRPTQDLDVVIDGDMEQIKDLQRRLDSTFPDKLHLLKSRWEVRGLRVGLGHKAPLLSNPDFLRQHTDSQSTGLILVDPDSPHLFRDLMDWESTRPRFLTDIAGGKIHYLYSPHHKETTSYQSGRNPEFISAIRFMIKALQFDLEISARDFELVQQITREFQPQKSLLPNYARRWIEKNSKKLILQAKNKERARALVIESGLGEKLMEIPGILPKRFSLSEFLRKELDSSQPHSVLCRQALQ